MREVRIRVPKIPAGLFANLLGLAALIAFAVCVGGFLSALHVPGCWWIAGVIGAAEAFWLSWIALSAQDAPSAEVKPLRKAAAA